MAVITKSENSREETKKPNFQWRVASVKGYSILTLAGLWGKCMPQNQYCCGCFQTFPQRKA
ncbi:hypothetical protein E2320_016304 [Naja naja]|nr:hypothetical protein E2320_016304 [Naja naja]